MGAGELRCVLFLFLGERSRCAKNTAPNPNARDSERSNIFIDTVYLARHPIVVFVPNRVLL